MTQIREILEELRQTVAGKGAMLMLSDGTTVDDSLEEGLDQDMVSGLTSFLTSTLNRSLAEGGMSGFTSFSIQSTHGRVLVVDLGEAYLVVLTNQFGSLSMGQPEIQDATIQLRRLVRLSV